MKTRNTYFIIILCLLGLTGCQSAEEKALVRLAQTDVLLCTSPDSALMLLNSIPEPERLTGALQADYILYLWEAQFKKGNPLPNDSLMNLSWRYYKDDEDLDKKGRAWMMRASALKMMRNTATQQIEAYKRAENCAPDIRDRALVSLLYEELGLINTRSLNFKRAVDYHRKSLAIDVERKDVEAQVRNIMHLLNPYFVAEYPDSTWWYLNRLQQMKDSITDSTALAKVYYVMALKYRELKRPTYAEQLLKKALQLSAPEFSSQIISELASIYSRTGRREKADSLYAKALQSPNIALRKNILTGMYNNAMSQKNYEKASEYAARLLGTQDTYYYESLHKETLEVQEKYDNMELLYRNARLKNRIYLILFLSLLLVGAGFLIAKVYTERLRRKYDCLQSDILLLQDRLVETENQNDRHRLDAEDLKQQIARKQRELEVMGNRLKLLFGANSLQLHPDSIRAAQVILVLTKDRKCDLSRDRVLIRHWLNITKNNFVTRLNSLHPELKEHYIDICCLMVLGLSVDEVADIMNVAPSTVSRYITQIGIDLKLPTRGKKGFLEFLNAFVLVKGE